MDWLQLLALFGGGTGGAFLVRQLFEFTKFVLKRKTVVDVSKIPGATLEEVLAMAEAMCLIDLNPRERPSSDPAREGVKSSDLTTPRLLADREGRDATVIGKTA